LIENGKIIVVNFTPGAGGKFIQNCLSLSRYCVLKRADWASWQGHLNGQWGFDYYLHKLLWALETIPPSQDRFWEWLAYELRDDWFYNGIFSDSIKRTPESFPEHIHLIARQGLWSTYSSHSSGSGEHCEKYWPTVKRINVLGDKFAAHWLPKKNQILKPGLEELATFPDAFNFDMDQEFYDYSKFSGGMRKMYEYVGFDDFDQVPLERFWRAYANIHQLEC
jgi:hypothetical protein